MADTYLPAVLVALFFLLILGALSSTADSDLAALSSIVMTDGYGHTVAGRAAADPRRMLLIGRATMVVATALAVAFASMRLNILDLLVFVGALWGALVFPVIASFYWNKVSNKAFTVSTLAAVATFLPVRFGWFPTDGASGFLIDVVSVVGVGVVLALMAFGFFGLRVAKIVGAVAIVVVAPFGIGFLHDYATLSGSLVAYAVSTVVCYVMSVRNPESFDFATIKERVGDFDSEPGSTDIDDDRPSLGEAAVRG